MRRQSSLQPPTLRNQEKRVADYSSSEPIKRRCTEEHVTSPPFNMSSQMEIPRRTDVELIFDRVQIERPCCDLPFKSNKPIVVVEALSETSEYTDNVESEACIRLSYIRDQEDDKSDSQENIAGVVSIYTHAPKGIVKRSARRQPIWLRQYAHLNRLRPPEALDN